MGIENSIPSEDSIFHPENAHYSLRETAEKFGYDGYLAAYREAGFEAHAFASAPHGVEILLKLLR